MTRPTSNNWNLLCKSSVSVLRGSLASGQSNPFAVIAVFLEILGHVLQRQCGAQFGLVHQSA
jgi:hypothetical protein